MEASKDRISRIRFTALLTGAAYVETDCILKACRVVAIIYAVSIAHKISFTVSSELL